MTKLSLEDLDRHLDNIRTQLQFLNDGLEATDHNAPDWFATDLISLRNKSGRLLDDMKRFRDQLETEGLFEQRSKPSSKRLSIEGAKLKTQTPKSQTCSSQNNAVSPPVDQSPTPRAKPAQVEGAYEVQHVDVTEEVKRRLHESRMRRLMETPSTSQKRKYDAYEEPRSGSTVDTEDEIGQRDGWSGSEYERTPTKRLKSSGTFDQTGKRKENIGEAELRGKLEGRTNIKRRRV